jgi:two-component system sensor histidine kinase UhpB
MAKDGESTSWFEERDAEGARELWEVYRENYDAVFDAMIAERKAKMAASFTADMLLEIVASKKRSFEQVASAFAGGWKAYEEYLCARARAYAARAIPFAAWYALSSAVEEILRPILIRKLASEPDRLEPVLRAFHVFMQRSLVVLGEEYMRASERRKTAVLEASFDAILTRDAEGRIVEVNAGAERMFGYRADEMVGHQLRELLVPASRQVEHRHATVPFLEKDESHGPQPSIELVLCRRDGSEFPVQLSTARTETDATVLYTGFVRDLTEQKRAEEELERKRQDAERSARALRASEQELRALAGRLQAVREEEGARIARDVHDVLGQALTALKLDLTWLARRLGPQPPVAATPEVLTAHCQSMLELVDGTLERVRAIASELRPAILDDLGIEAALEWQTADFTRRTGIHVDLEVASTPTRGIGPDQATALFRIVQEALTNVVRHAEARRVAVCLAAEGPEAVLVVSDDGRGLPPRKPGERDGLGVIGMRERATILGGRVELSSRAGGGTMVVAHLPLGRDGSRDLRNGT